MGLDRKGTQFRIRVRPPSKFKDVSFRTKDVGMKGGLQLIIGRPKGRLVTKVQSFRVSTKDFMRRGDKLIPTTPRGVKEKMSLKKRKTGLLGKAIQRYF